MCFIRFSLLNGTGYGRKRLCCCPQPKKNCRFAKKRNF